MLFIVKFFKDVKNEENSYQTRHYYITNVAISVIEIVINLAPGD